MKMVSRDNKLTFFESSSSFCCSKNCPSFLKSLHADTSETTATAIKMAKPSIQAVFNFSGLLMLKPTSKAMEKTAQMIRSFSMKSSKAANTMLQKPLLPAGSLWLEPYFASLTSREEALIPFL